MFGFEYPFDTQFVLCIVSRYRLILDELYVMFQGWQLGVFIVIVYKAPVSPTRVFKPCYSPDLWKADFGGQSFNIVGWTVTSSVRFENPSRPNILSY